MTDVMFLGHAGFRLSAPEFTLVCDAWFDTRGANLGSWHQYPRNDHLEVDRLRQADWVAISHEHLDHLDHDFIAGLSPHTRVVIARYPGTNLRDRVSASSRAEIVEIPPWERLPLDDRGSWIAAVPERSPMWHDTAFLMSVGGLTILNCNDAKLSVAQIRRARHMAGGTVDLMLLQGSRATWHPAIYDNYTAAEARDLAWRRKVGKFRNARRMADAAAPRLTVPFAGPPCFLDDDLRHLNAMLERGEDGAYAEPDEAAAWLVGTRPDLAVATFRPGDVLDLDTFEVARDRRPAPNGPDGRDFYLARYAADRADSLSALRREFPEPGPGIWTLFEEHFAWLGSLSPYFTEKIDMTVRFVVTGSRAGSRDVTFDGNGAHVGPPGTEKPGYVVTVDGRWLLPVLERRVPWESLFLSMRLRLFRDPDEYNDYFVGLLKHADAEALRAVESYETDRDSASVIEVSDGARRTYEIARYCPHGGEDLSSAAAVEDGRIICFRHNFSYDLATGECVNGKSARLSTRIVRDG